MSSLTLYLNPTSAQTKYGRVNSHITDWLKQALVYLKLNTLSLQNNFACKVHRFTTVIFTKSLKVQLLILGRSSENSINKGNGEHEKVKVMTAKKVSLYGINATVL